MTILPTRPNDNAGLDPGGHAAASATTIVRSTYALDDARAAAVAAMTADTAANRACRNTVVVLITGGKDGGDAAYTRSAQPGDDRDARS